MLNRMQFRWLTVFLDFSAETFPIGVAFWREVTGCGLSSFRGPTADFATLLPLSGDPYLRVQRLLSGGGGCHLDLHTADGSLEEAADRAVELGARVRHREAGELIVLDSPGGFTFCVAGWDGERVVPSPIGGSVLDTLCLDIPPARFDAEVAFWAALTGGEARPAPEPGFTSLKGPPGMPVRLLLQRLDDAAPWRVRSAGPRARRRRRHRRGRRGGAAHRPRRAGHRNVPVLDRADRSGRPRVLRGPQAA